MAGVDLEKCKRIVQYFWDPEPKNDTVPEAPIWCLGQEYTPALDISKDTTGNQQFSTTFNRIKLTATADTADTDTKEDTVGSSSSWPEAFLDDFESRIWMTYRSNFTPIPRNNTPEATSSMTLGVRLRSQLMDSQGFTSDTGWGCMIRSGQSLLANTLSMIQLGRGTSHHHTTTTTQKLVRVQC